jgi:hypothetical protein
LAGLTIERFIKGFLKFMVIGQFMATVGGGRFYIWG